MTQLAKTLETEGYTLRSGRAHGADWAFERGVKSDAEIYLPWPGFGKELGPRIKAKLERPHPDAYILAKKYHPAWERLTQGGRALHSRNIHQIIGSEIGDPIPSDFVVCWTKDGKRGGGTGQAIRIALDYGIPIYDLAIETDLDDLMDLIYFGKENNEYRS